MRRKSSRATSSRGLFIPLLAVIALGIIAVIFVLGFGTSRAREVKQRAQRKVEDMCEALLTSAYLPRQAAEKFKKEIDELARNPIPYFELNDAVLVVPTYKDGELPVIGTRSYESFRDAGGQRIFNDCPMACSHSDPTTCGCWVIGDVGANNDFISQNFAPTFWDQDRDVGNKISCFIKGRVRTILAGSSEVVAKATYTLPVRGNFPSGGSDISDLPSLTIAVAPELTTRAGDPRFRFGSDPNPFDQNRQDSAQNRRDLDPLSRFVMGGNTDSIFERMHGREQELYPLIPGEILLRNLRSANISKTTNGSGAPVVLPPGQSDYNRNQNYLLPDAAEISASCMSPVVAVRNSLVSTLVNLASNNASLRSMTRLAFVNPQNRNAANTFSYSTIPNPPVVSINFGEDLTSRNFRLPFVSYFSGDLSNPPPAQFGTGLAGMISPFQSNLTRLSSDPDPNYQANAQHYIDAQGLITSQLRDCFHLYSNRPSFERYDAPGLINDDFEPGEFIFRSKLNSTVQNWDQACLWQSGCSTFSDGLTGAELAAITGAVQSCPFSDANYPGGACSKPPAPINSGQATYDLRPDLAGLLHFVSNTPFAGTPVLALKTPGLHPLRAGFDINTHALRPFGDDALAYYTNPTNAFSPLVLVTHQALSSGEAAKLSALVADIPTIPITVIYIPSELPAVPDLDLAMDQNVSRLVSAFHANQNGFDNRVFILSPYGSTRPANFHCSDPTNQSLCFLEYWEDLLGMSQGSSPENHIAVIAKSLFADRILKAELSQ